MAAFIKGFDGATNGFSSESSVTITLGVVNADEEPIQRMVYVYHNNDMSAALGFSQSSPSTGEASFTLPGTPNTEFAFVVQGEAGENCVVHSHKKAG